MKAKLCKDCKFNVNDHVAWSTCHHPDVPLDDLSTGAHQRAASVRDYGACGRAGRLFVSKHAQTIAASAEQFPELDPLPGARPVSWWARKMARLYRWVNS